MVGALAFVNLLLCLGMFEPKIHTGGDSSHYVLLAESILRIGDGYADTLAPGAPVPHTKYPPGYPMLLVPLLALFGRDIVVLKLLSVALTVASVALFATLARERMGEGGWLPVGLAFAVSPVVVDYSHWLLSESAFLLCTLVALLLLERAGREEGLGPYFWLATVAMAGSYWVRSIGAALVVAGTLHYALSRQWRKCLAYSSLGAALTLPWFLRGRALAGTGSPYLEQFLLKSVYEPEAGYHDLGGMIGRFFANVEIYSAREMPRALVGSDATWATTTPLKALAIGVCVIGLVGFVRVVRSRSGPAEVYFALSLLAVLLFEEVVSDVRYLMPLVPLVLLYAHEGLTWLERAGERIGGRRTFAAVAMVLIAMVGAASQAVRVPANLDMVQRYARGDEFAGYHPNWRSFFLAADWVAANTPADAAVTVRKPRLFNLRTDRRVVEYPFSTDATVVLEVILATDYVVIDQISGTTGRYLVPAVERVPNRFRIVYRSPEGPPTWVLQVLPPPTG
jgi:4-amino-4-deoxy-L-arabinose transferase-like glycosyltransferase